MVLYLSWVKVHSGPFFFTQFFTQQNMLGFFPPQIGGLIEIPKITRNKEGGL